MGQVGVFGHWLKQQRKALDLTQHALAQRVGCALSTLKKIEEGVLRPSQQMAERLADALAIVPADRQAFLHLARRLSAPAPNALASSVASSDLAGPHNLPAPLTSFVGRRHELDSTTQLLATHRLLTFTGPGGTGKTRLALQLASTAHAQFPDGVWLVELASLADPALVASAIARVLGVREEPGQAVLTALTTRLREKQLLLLLDNCEHLIARCAELAEVVLQTCVGLRILATSRVPLGIPGEAIFRVAPLAIPSRRQRLPLDQLLQVDAVRLFVERAQLVQPSFQVTESSVAALIQVCRQLDGLPLALELAAAHTRMLAVAQIAARFNERFHVLMGANRTRLPRHQTLQALIDWSYFLLHDAERNLLCRLAVFVDGWTLDAAEAVCSRTDDHDVLELLTQLVDASLVEVELASETARYRMLETIRRYALEKLANSGEAEQVRCRHAHYYLQLAEQAATERMDASWTARVATLEVELDNLRAALGWSQTAAGDAILGLRLAKALLYVWMRGGYWAEARSWLTRVLAHPAAAERTQLRAQVLTSAGYIFGLLSDYGAAQSAFDESLAICQACGDTHEQAWVLNRIGWLARSLGDTSLVRIQLAESLRLYRELGDNDGIIEGLNTLGLAVIADDLIWATALLEESLSLSRQMGNVTGAAWALNHLGRVAEFEQDYKRAAQFHLESLGLFSSLGDQHPGIPWAYQSLGACALARSDLAGAQKWLAAGLVQFRHEGSREGVAMCLSGLGNILGLSNWPARAARVWGACEAAWQAIGREAAPTADTTYAQAVATVRGYLGQEAFTAEWMAGRMFTLEQVIEEALAEV